MHKSIGSNNFLVINWTSKEPNTPVHTCPVFSLEMNKYLYWHGFYTEEQMIDMGIEEKVWRDSLEDYSWNELMQIFPEAKVVARKSLQNETLVAKSKLAEADRVEKELDDLIYRKCSRANEGIVRDMLMAVYVTPLREGCEKLIRSNTFKLSALAGVKRGGGSITDEDIARARMVPIKNFVKVDRYGKAICPLHSEKTPSFKVYEKQNTWWCYGSCACGGDVIDLVRKMYGLGFIDAVKKLV